MENKISLFGNGFIGKEYSSNYPCLVIDRNSLVAKTNKLLTFVSTVDNYNVYENPYLDIDTNLTFLIRLLEKSKSIFGSDFEINFVSSWFVYGVGAKIPAKEDDKCNPTGFYSITKHAAENMLISYCETFGIKYRILRMANVLGINDTKASLKKNALQHITKCISTKIPIEVYKGNEEVIRDYIHVSDAARGIHLVISDPSTINSITNIGNGIPLVMYDLIDYVVKKTNGEVLFKDPHQFHKQVQAQKMYLDISKLESLGYKPKYSVYDALDELIESYTK